MGTYSQTAKMGRQKLKATASIARGNQLIFIIGLNTILDK